MAFLISGCEQCKNKQLDTPFCPSCGRKSSPLATKTLILSIIGLICLAIAAYLISGSLTGKRPTLVIEASALPEELKSMRTLVAANPTDLEMLKQYAKKLSDNMRSGESSREVIFELLETLSKLLENEPSDREALLMMAELSFNQRAFDKAREFYERYLNLEPDDKTVRANLASSLSFLERFDDSIKILEKLLAEDPKNFQAQAYLAISYAQRGDKDRALNEAQIALSLAPDEEAKIRLSSFIKSMEAPDKATKEAVDSPEGNIIRFILEHPITGPRTITHKIKDKMISFVMKEFPMDAMPEDVRERFYQKLKDILLKDETRKIDTIIFESETGELLGKTTLN